MHDPRLANLLGAMALAVTDLMLTGATAAAGTSSSGAAALVVLNESDGLSATELGRRVGLTQSASARMVDALEQRGLVERQATLGRWVAVHLTADGQATARQLLDARGGELAAVVAILSPADQETLAALLDTLLTTIYGRIGSSERICRFCDRGACIHAGATCPVGQAHRDHTSRAQAHRDAGGEDGGDGHG
jgi:MarR family transcriptional repressor of emrRAB